MLKIKKLTAIVNDELGMLDSLSLSVNKGEIHAIMGPKNSGKSALVHSIIGDPTITIKDGSIKFNKTELTELTPEQRSLSGIFACVQYPPCIEGLSNLEFTKIVLKAHNDPRNTNEIEKIYKELCKVLGLSSNHGYKHLNHETMTMSECRKNELMLMYLLDPDLIILDEIDVDVEPDELEEIAHHIRQFLNHKSKAAIVVTHNTALLDILIPTHVHVLVDGDIKLKGTTDLYKRIIEDGYSQFSQG